MTTEHSASSIDYLHPTTAAPPGPFAIWWLAPWPWWCWIGPLVLLVAPATWFTGRPLSPAALYMWPAILIVFGGISLLGFAVIAVLRVATRANVAARHRAEVTSESKSIKSALVVLWLYWLFLGTPLGIRVAAWSRFGTLEQVRQRVEEGTMPPGSTFIAPLYITDTELGADGVTILYTDGKRGSFPGGGAGFLYLPPGV